MDPLEWHDRISKDLKPREIRRLKPLITALSVELSPDEVFHRSSAIMMPAGSITSFGVGVLMGDRLVIQVRVGSSEGLMWGAYLYRDMLAPFRMQDTYAFTSASNGVRLTIQGSKDFCRLAETLANA